MRVHKKDTLFIPEKSVIDSGPNEKSEYETLFSDLKNHLVFKISVVTELPTRLVYIDILKYMEQAEQELNLLK